MNVSPIYFILFELLLSIAHGVSITNNNVGSGSGVFINNNDFDGDSGFISATNIFDPNNFQFSIDNNGFVDQSIITNNNNNNNVDANASGGFSIINNNNGNIEAISSNGHDNQIQTNQFSSNTDDLPDFIYVNGKLFKSVETIDNQVSVKGQSSIINNNNIGTRTGTGSGLHVNINNLSAKLNGTDTENIQFKQFNSNKQSFVTNDRSRPINRFETTRKHFINSAGQSITNNNNVDSGTMNILNSQFQSGSGRHIKNQNNGPKEDEMTSITNNNINRGAGVRVNTNIIPNGSGMTSITNNNF